VAFKLFLVCSFILLGRPQDILAFLQPMRPALVLTVLAMVALIFGDRRQELAAALATSEWKRYLLFFLVMIVGIPFAYHRRLAFQGVFLGYVVNMLFFVLLVSHVTSLRRLKSLVWVICLSTVVYSVFGGLLQSEGFGGGRFEVLGGVFDANDTAYVLLSLFPLCLYFVWFDEGLLKRLVAVAAVFGAIATIFLTGSRGGILGFGSVLLILLMTKTGGIRKGHKILLGLVLASAWFLMKDKIDVERYMTLSDVSSDYNVTEQGGRIELWQAAIDLSLANPITGVGVHCFAFAHSLARDLAGESYRQWHVVHNSILQVAVEVGLIGFGIFVLINLQSLYTFFRISRTQLQSQSPETREIGALSGLMLLGFVGLLVSGFFLSQGYSIFSTLYFALAAAMGRLQAGSSAVIEATRGAADTSAAQGWRNSGKARQSMISHSLPPSRKVRFGSAL
jgi:O-antigen ligase